MNLVPYTLIRSVGHLLDVVQHPDGTLYYRNDGRISERLTEEDFERRMAYIEPQGRLIDKMNGYRIYKGQFAYYIYNSDGYEITEQTLTKAREFCEYV